MSFFKRKKNYLIIGGVLALLIAGGTYFYPSKSSAETKYQLTQPTRGMFITSISGSGQVSADNEVEVKSEASGELTKLNVVEGQKVKTNDVLATLDPALAQSAVRDAAQGVRDAQVYLEAAVLSLNKLKEPASGSSLISAQNAVNQAERDVQKLLDPPEAADVAQAQADLKSAQDQVKLAADGKTPLVVQNAIDATVINMQSAVQTLGNVLSDADNVLGRDNTNANITFKSLLSVLDTSHLYTANAEYDAAKSAIESARTQVEALSILGASETQTRAAAQTVQTAFTRTGTMLYAVSNVLANTLTSYNFSQSSLNQLVSTNQSDRTSLNSKTSSLHSQLQAIDSAYTQYQNSQNSVLRAQNALDKLLEPADPASVAAAQDNLRLKRQALDELKAGADAIEIKQAQNTVAQRQSALASARNKLVDAQKALGKYTIRAPFDGTVAGVKVEKNSAVSQGTVIMTLVTDKKIATLTLNETDAAKIALGQKATITFDAVDELSITGEVAQIDVQGTVSQGVASFGVKIALDTQDERIRPGMTANAVIVTQTIPDALTVPNAAIKSMGDQSYVLIVDNPPQNSTNPSGVTLPNPPREQIVGVGAANDSVTVITSGLNGDENVVARTITASAQATGANSSGLGGVRIPGMSAGTAVGTGGGNVRFMTR